MINSNSGWKNHQVLDGLHYNFPVASFDVPANWEVRSQVTWKYENVSQPVSIYAIAYDPNGVDWVELLPIESYYWLQPNHGFDQPGNFKFGQFLLQPTSPTDAITRWIVPRYRGNRSKLKILGVDPVPDLATRLSIPPQKTPLYSIMAKIEYEENGKEIEEEIFGIMVIQPAIPTTGTTGASGTITQTNWGFMRLFSFRSLKGQLVDRYPAYWNLVQSVKSNPQWEQEVCSPIMQNIQQGFQQFLQAGYDQVNAATRMSQMISAQNDAFLQQQQQKPDSD